MDLLLSQAYSYCLDNENHAVLAPKANINAFAAPKVWQKEESLLYVNKMISKYPEGRIKDPKEKNYDLQMMSQYPEISTLWFMYFLTGIFEENSNANISKEFWRFEQNYPEDFFKSKALFEQTKKLIYSLQKVVLGDKIYITSHELGIRIFVADKNLALFEPISAIEKQKSLIINAEINTSI